MNRDRRGEPSRATADGPQRATPTPIGKTTLTQLLLEPAPPLGHLDVGSPAAGESAAEQRQAARPSVDIAALFGRPGTAGNTPVQCKAASPLSAFDNQAVPEIAAQGVTGEGVALPHLTQIQASFGHHDVSGVRAHQGRAAFAAARDLGADAYTVGNSVAFAGAPDLHTAAHVVQQRGGVQLKGGIGQPGDAYERHADAVVAGGSAAPLLDQVASSGGQRGAAVQRTPASSARAPAEPGAHPPIAPPNPGINKPGFIDNSAGANIRTGPREAGGQIVRDEPLPPATRVFVSGAHPNAPEWWYVTATLHDKTMVRGYVQGGRVNVDVPEPLAELRQLVGGETAEGLAKEKFGHAVSDGHDLRYYENVLLYVNQGRAGIQGTYQDPGVLGGGSNNIQLVAGHRIWLVSAEYAKALQAVVPSGSLTGGAVAKAKRFAGHLEDILHSVTESSNHFEEVAGQFAQALRDHLAPIVGFTAAFLIAEAGSMFLAAVPTGVTQAAAAVIQLALTAFGASGMVQAGVEALKHGCAWLTISWTAQGKPERITAASKEFLRMLVAVGLAALSRIGAKGNYGNALKIASNAPPGALPAVATIGAGRANRAAASAAVSVGPSVGAVGVASNAAMQRAGEEGPEDVVDYMEGNDVRHRSSSNDHGGAGDHAPARDTHYPEGYEDLDELDGHRIIEPASTAAEPAAARVPLRETTKASIRAEAPKTRTGDFIDPNTGEVIPKEGPFDYGHKPGFEWWRTQQLARAKNWTREQIIEYENDPSHYQIEAPGPNRSRKYEKPK